MNAVMIRLDLTSWRSSNDDRYRLGDPVIAFEQYVAAPLETKIAAVLDRRADTPCEDGGEGGEGVPSGTRLGAGRAGGLYTPRIIMRGAAFLRWKQILPHFGISPRHEPSHPYRLR